MLLEFPGEFLRAFCIHPYHLEPTRRPFPLHLVFQASSSINGECSWGPSLLQINWKCSLKSPDHFLYICLIHFNQSQSQLFFHAVSLSVSLSLSLFLFFSLSLSHSLAVFENIPTRSWYGKRCNCRFQQWGRGVKLSRKHKHARILNIQKHGTCGQSASLGIIFCNTPRKCSRPHHMAALCIPTLQPPQPTCLMLVAWCLNIGTPIHREFHKGRPKTASLCGWVWLVYTHQVSGIKQSGY